MQPEVQRDRAAKAGAAEGARKGRLRRSCLACCGSGLVTVVFSPAAGLAVSRLGQAGSGREGRLDEGTDARAAMLAVDSVCVLSRLVVRVDAEGARCV